MKPIASSLRLSPYAVGIFVATLLAIMIWSPKTLYGQAGQAETAFKKGQYVLACSLATKALVAKPTNRNAQEVLLMAYPAAVEEVGLHASGQAHITTTPNQSGINACQSVISKYRELNQLNRQISPILPLVDKKSGETIRLDLTDFGTELAQMEKQLIETRNQAAHLAYERGVNLLNMEGKDNARQAAHAFKEAMSYITNYKDSQQQYNIARTKGTRTLVLNARESGNLTGHSGFDNFKAKVIFLVEEQIVSNFDVAEFTQLLSYNNSAAQQADLELEIELLEVRAPGPQTMTQQTTETKSVKTGEREYVDDKGKTRTQNIYSDVSALVTIYTRKVETTVEVGYKLIDRSTGLVLSSERQTGVFRQEDRWATRQGDDRALSTNAVQLVRAGAAIPVLPSTQDQQQVALKQAVASLVGRLGANLQ